MWTGQAESPIQVLSADLAGRPIEPGQARADGASLSRQNIRSPFAGLSLNR